MSSVTSSQEGPRRRGRRRGASRCRPWRRTYRLRRRAPVGSRTMSPTPPAAPRRPHPITPHGDERVDDWYWLRSDERDDPAVLDLLRAENDFVAADRKSVVSGKRVSVRVDLGGRRV